MFPFCLFALISAIPFSIFFPPCLYPPPPTHPLVRALSASSPDPPDCSPPYKEEDDSLIPLSDCQTLSDVVLPLILLPVCCPSSWISFIVNNPTFWRFFPPNKYILLKFPSVPRSSFGSNSAVREDLGMLSVSSCVGCQTLTACRLLRLPHCSRGVLCFTAAITGKKRTSIRNEENSRRTGPLQSDSPTV